MERSSFSYQVAKIASFPLVLCRPFDKVDRHLASSKFFSVPLSQCFAILQRRSQKGRGELNKSWSGNVAVPNGYKPLV